MSCLFFFFTHTYLYIASCFTKSPKCVSDEHKDHKNSFSDFDFERSSYISEIDFKKGTDESDLPPKMLRLLTMEDKQILPHQKVTELVNLGTRDEKKKVKKYADISRLILEEENNRFFKEYVDIFAWSYQDMLGLSIEIIEHQLPMKPECGPVQQKFKRVKLEMLLKIKEEVRK